MIIEILDMMGLNASLIVDVLTVTCIIQFVGFIMFQSLFKGITGPILNAKLKKETGVAIIDLGGIETPMINYKTGDSSVRFSHNDNNYEWPIPDGVEKMLSNKIRYLTASRGYGSCTNIHLIGQELNNQKALLSPKATANVIDDRSKEISDKLLSDVNKPMIYAAGVGLVFIVVLFGYLIFIKAMEYDLARQFMQEAQNYATTTTTLKLPPLD